MGCHQPRYQRVVLHNCWLHNRFVVRQGHTAYELCADRPFAGRLALFGEHVLGFSRVVYARFPNMDQRHMARKDRQQRCSYHSCSWKVLCGVAQGTLGLYQNRAICKWWAKLRLHRGRLDMFHLEHNSFCQSESLRLPFCRCHQVGLGTLILKL